jgi:hypothetical protein
MLAGMMVKMKKWKMVPRSGNEPRSRTLESRTTTEIFRLINRIQRYCLRHKTTAEIITKRKPNMNSYIYI